jgi:hypothetical protein
MTKFWSPVKINLTSYFSSSIFDNANDIILNRLCNFSKADVMGKFILTCLLLCFVVTGNAQVSEKPKLNELNQDQLNLVLAKSQKTIKTGKILTFTGLGTASVGVLLLIAEASKVPSGGANGNTAETGAYVALIGGAVMWIGIPVWIAGGTRKHKIELQLANFKSPGSASVNGIGLKVRF